MEIDHTRYQSPLSWRYGSAAMREVWSEATKRRLMRRAWLALARAQAEFGLVDRAAVEDLERTVDDIDIERAAEIEARTRHDVMAEILAWAEQAPVGGGAIHLGATSEDINDTVYALRLREAGALVRSGLVDVILALAMRVDETADLVTQGWTHLQPAAPTTVGYRLASSLQDFATDLHELDAATGAIRAKGFKGATGTGASFGALLAGRGVGPSELENAAMERLGIEAALVTTQVAPRKQEWLLLNALAGIAASASRLAFNVRLLQSPPYGEWSEGFEPGQVGSSAMPWKRNPIDAENVNSLARLVATLPGVAWQNEALSLLERTLDDSANRRLILPEGFLLVDEILARSLRLCRRLVFETEAISATLDRFGPFAATELVLLSASAAGGDRQELHERIRRASLVAWAAIERGEPNPLAELLAEDELIASLLPRERILELAGGTVGHVGDAPERARAMASLARERASARAGAPTPAGGA